MLRRPVCKSHYFLCLFLLCCFFISSIYSQTVKIEPQISKVSPQVSEESLGIQGNLEDMGSSANGSYDFETCVCDVVDCTPAPTVCTENTGVQVTNGNYNYKVNFGTSIWDGNPRWFRIGVRRLPTDSYTILSPTQMISSSPYAIYTFKAFMVVDNAITSSSIMDNAVTSADIANDTITAADIAANSITFFELDRDSVTFTELADNAVTSSKIVDNSVTSADIQDGTIDSQDFSPGWVLDTQQHIADNSIGSTQISDNAVTSNKIADNAVTSSKIFDDTITSADIQDNTLTAADLIDNAVTSNKISDNAVTSNKLDSNMGLAFYSARINGLGPFAGTDVFGSVTGITTAAFAETDVQTGTPNRTCRAGNLFVRQTVAPVSGTRVYIVRINGSDTSLACSIFGSNTTCTSSPGFLLTISGGSELSYRVTTSGNPATTDATLGFECR